MVRYSVGFREKMVAKMLGPDAVSACELSRRVGVPHQTLSRWLKAVKGHAMSDFKEEPTMNTPRRPKDWSAEERLAAVTRAATMTEDELGAFLRQSGLKSADLERWRDSMLKAVATDGRRPAARRNPQDRKRIRELERELRRKEKALAETAALLTLKKKAQEIWGDPEDDIP